MQASIFESSDGKVLMKYWDDVYMNELSYVKGDTHETAFREGTKDMIFDIKKRIR